MTNQIAATTPKNLAAGDVVTGNHKGVRLTFDGQDGVAWDAKAYLTADDQLTVAEVTSRTARTRTNSGRATTEYLVTFTDGRTITVGASQRLRLVA